MVRVQRSMGKEQGDTRVQPGEAEGHISHINLRGGRIDQAGISKAFLAADEHRCCFPRTRVHGLTRNRMEGTAAVIAW